MPERLLIFEWEYKNSTQKFHSIVKNEYSVLEMRQKGLTVQEAFIINFRRILVCLLFIPKYDKTRAQIAIS